MLPMTVLCIPQQQWKVGKNVDRELMWHSDCIKGIACIVICLLIAGEVFSVHIRCCHVFNLCNLIVGVATPLNHPPGSTAAVLC